MTTTTDLTILESQERARQNALNAVEEREISLIPALRRAAPFLSTIAWVRFARVTDKMECSVEYQISHDTSRQIYDEWTGLTRPRLVKNIITHSAEDGLLEPWPPVQSFHIAPLLPPTKTSDVRNLEKRAAVASFSDEPVFWFWLGMVTVLVVWMWEDPAGWQSLIDLSSSLPNLEAMSGTISMKGTRT